MRRPVKLSNSKKRQLHALLDQAVQSLNRGQAEVAVQLCLRMEAIQPGNGDATNIRGIIANQQGDRAQALSLFQQAVRTAPRRYEFHLNLASLLLQSGQHGEALSSYHQALKLKPHELQIQLAYAGALIAMRHFDQATSLLTAAYKRHPRHIDLLMKLFRACYEGGDTKRAEAWLQEVITLNPDHVDAHYCYALLLLQDGRQQDGEREIRATLRLNPEHADAEGLLFEISARRERDADVERLAAMFDQAQENSAQRARLGFVYGKALNDLGDYDAAFRCYAEANAIRNRASGYDQDRELAQLQMIMQTFTRAVIEKTSGLSDASPIFIVGMPRCGSTLVEQILASHPDVTPRGEYGFFEDAIRQCGADSLQIIQQLSIYTPQQWRALAQQYLKLLCADTGDMDNEASGAKSGRRYSDKSLSNIRMIGAIHCALPGARIIHVRRHPLDTCWSIFHNHLQGKHFDYGHDLEALGHYYHAYLQLMQHWRGVLPAGALIEIDYEQLVKYQQEQTRRLLEDCGLAWHEQCLRFYKSANAVRTASFMQVRKPISSGAIGIWKHYEHQLQPLVRILGDAAHPPVS